MVIESVVVTDCATVGDDEVRTTDDRRLVEEVEKANDFAAIEAVVNDFVAIVNGAKRGNGYGTAFALSCFGAET